MSDDNDDLDEKIETLAQWIADTERIVIFTGAGISTESGVPDFRGPDGVWTRRDKGLPPPKWGVTPDQVRPNEGHMAIIHLLKMGKLRFLISQNVDNLHIRSGIPDDMIAELHGNGKKVKCLECDARLTKEEVGWDDRRFGKGYRTSGPVKGQPTCPECGGRIISSVINFGDPMPEKEMELAEHHSKHCDLFIVLGSSLVVTPAAHMPRYARVTAKAKVVIVNKGETPFDDDCDLRFWEGIGEVFPPAVQRAMNMLGCGG